MISDILNTEKHIHVWKFDKSWQNAKMGALILQNVILEIIFYLVQKCFPN